MLSPLDRLPGDGTLEDEVCLVGPVDGQFEGKSVGHMDVRKQPLLAMLADPLALHVVDDPCLVEHQRDGFDAVGEDVKIDVRTFAHVAGEHTADQPRSESPQQLHQPQGFQPHLPQFQRAVVALVKTRQRLDFIAYFGVARQIRRLDPTATDPPCRLLFGAKVLRFLPMIHQTRGFPRNLPPQFRVIHEMAP